MARKMETETLGALLGQLKVSIGYLSSEHGRGCQVKSQSQKIYEDHSLRVKEVEVNFDADQSHSIYGKRIVFTGTLHSMSRIDAWNAVVSLGVIPQDTVTTETNIVAIGEQELSKLRLGATKKFQICEGRAS